MMSKYQEIDFLEDCDKHRKQRRLKMRESFRASSNPYHRQALALAEAGYGVKTIAQYTGLREYDAKILVTGG